MLEIVHDDCPCPIGTCVVSQVEGPLFPPQRPFGGYCGCFSFIWLFQPIPQWKPSYVEHSDCLRDGLRGSGRGVGSPGWRAGPWAAVGPLQRRGTSFCSHRGPRPNAHRPSASAAQESLRLWIFANLVGGKGCVGGGWIIISLSFLKSESERLFSCGSKLFVFSVNSVHSFFYFSIMLLVVVSYWLVNRAL